MTMLLDIFAILQSWMPDLCVADDHLLFYNEAYRSADSALMSMPSLQCLATTVVTSIHNLLYKHFYQLVVFQLTLPVTSASRERAHSKVGIVKSAVRSSMTSESLEDVILISSEKTVLDSIELAVIDDKFAATARALLL